MLLDPGCHREYIRVEDDIFGRETDTKQQIISALANLDLAPLGVGLARLVERHDDNSRAIGHAQPGMIQELLLAFFHRNRIDDGFAADAF